VKNVAHLVRGGQRLAHVAVLLTIEVAEHEFHEQDQWGVTGGVELGEPGAVDKVKENEERSLVLGDDKVHG